MIHIIDYGLGNVQAFVTVFKRLGIATVRAKTKDDLQNCTKIILPGVGAFDHAMNLLDASGMRATIEQLVSQQAVPVLGVCVGMQILAERSDEGVKGGLGWVSGTVRSLAMVPAAAALPMPHMGWNDVNVTNACPLFNGFNDDARFYFLHSFYFDTAKAADSAATAEYGYKFDCAVQNKNVFGVQFHPEKSHRWGAALLKNFAEL